MYHSSADFSEWFWLKCYVSSIHFFLNSDLGLLSPAVPPSFEYAPVWGNSLLSFQVKGQILVLIGSVMELDPYFALVNYSSIDCHIFCKFCVALPALSNPCTHTHTHTHTHTTTTTTTTTTNTTTATDTTTVRAVILSGRILLYTWFHLRMRN
jgi:hypothetical protein